MTAPVCLMVCTGKDCRAGDGYQAMVELAAGLGARDVACQDLCHGPVVGVQVGDDVRWYQRVRKKRHRRLLADAVERGRFPADLRHLEARKRRDDVPKGRRSRPLRA